MDLVTDVNGLPGSFSKIQGLTLQITTPLGSQGLFSEKPSEFQLRMPIALGFLKQSLREKLGLPIHLVGHAKGKAWLGSLTSKSDLKSEEKKKILETQLSIESFKSELLDLNLAAQLEIHREKDQFQISPVLNCKVDVLKLRGLQPLLEAYHIPLPAPLDVLDGQIHFLAQGPVKQDAQGSHFPLQLVTKLSSKRQVMNTDSSADVGVSPDFKKIHIEAVSKIQDLQLELPPLNPVGGKPRLTRDSRILKQPGPPKKKKSALTSTFNFQVETTGAGSIRLLSEFFKPHLPLTLNFKIQKGGNKAGFVQTEPFAVEYLKRRVQVEKMRLDLNQIESDVIPVDARLKVQQTLYTIFIDVKGDIKNPHITLSSDPYLPENEIISVLIYDRTNEQLASADAETAGHVQAAVADRAIGLFGLWAFASTPIRSFSYNPVTKVYSATVVLAKGVTAGIGTTWESTAHLELRKRVSRQWMLTARWLAGDADEEASTELVLEWEKRF